MAEEKLPTKLQRSNLKGNSLVAVCARGGGSSQNWAEMLAMSAPPTTVPPRFSSFASEF